MDFAYTPAQQELKARAAAYAELLMDYEDEAEEAGGPLPKETVEKLTRAAMDAGVYGDQHARRVGRRGPDPARPGDRRGGVRQGDQLPVGHPVAAVERARATAPEQREKFLLPIIRGERFDAFAVTEPDAGSDAGRDRDHRDPVDGGWLINGEKWFVTCGDVADFLVVQANALSRRRIHAVPGREGHAGRADHPDAALHALRRQRAPGVLVHRRVRTRRDRARRGRPGLRTDQGVVHRRAPDDRRAHGRRRRARAEAGPGLGGAARAVRRADRDFQLIQGMLADCAVDIAVNRAFTHQVAWEADNGVDRKTLHAKASMAKLSASEAAGRVIDRCVQIFGGRGYDRAYPVERMYRELRVDRIWEGTSEIQRLIIANELIKRGTAFLDLPVAR